MTPKKIQYEEINVVKILEVAFENAKEIIEIFDSTIKEQLEKSTVGFFPPDEKEEVYGTSIYHITDDVYNLIS